jgi:peptidoglycan/LPS O-acetylase OafA/YrhL
LKSLTVDALKAAAAQVIVLHHLASYGPMARAAALAAPSTIDWLYGYGRMAVQVLLVVAGFLAARSLLASPRPGLREAPLTLIRRRYLRLAWPFGIAVTLAVIAAELARFWTDDDILPASASAWQYLSHWLLLHGVLDQPSLSTGVWYVAVDFQLYGLTVLLLWAFAARPGGETLVLALVCALALASMQWLRHIEALDDWAPYFFHAYGMGLLAGWQSRRSGWATGAAVFVVGIAAIATLLQGWDWRLALGTVTAALLFASTASRETIPLSPAISRSVHWLGASSYALFLVHFPVSMLVNAAQDRFGWHGPTDGLLAMAIAWTLAMLAAAGFHRWIEPVGDRLAARL